MFNALGAAIITNLVGNVGAHVMNEGTVASIQDILTQATSLFNWIFTTSLPTIVTTLTSNAILLIGLLISLCGLVVGMMRRLMNLS